MTVSVSGECECDSEREPVSSSGGAATPTHIPHTPPPHTHRAGRARSLMPATERSSSSSSTPLYPAPFKGEPSEPLTSVQVRRRLPSHGAGAIIYCSTLSSPDRSPALTQLAPVFASSVHARRTSPQM